MNIKWSFLALSIATATANAQTEFGTRSDLFESYEMGTNEVYVNTYEVTDSDLKEIKRKLVQGDIIIMDNISATSAEASKSMVSNVLGFGVKAPVVAAAMINGQLNIKSISVYGDTESSYDDFYINPEASQELIDSLDDAKAELTTKSLLSRMGAVSDAKSLSPTTRALEAEGDDAELPDRPSVDLLKTTNTEIVLVEARQERLSCPMPGLKKEGFLGTAGYKYTDDENMEDPCIENNSRAALTYTVEKMRSEAVANGTSDDINFVRVSISPESGGTGIFLTDELVQDKFILSLFQPWSTELNPFADNYRFSVYSDDDDVRLHGHIPAQENPSNQISETSTVDVGISITVGVSGDSSGSGSANVSGTYSYNVGYQRSVSYETAEYTLENATGSEALDQAGWVYDRKYEQNKCSWIYARGPEQTSCARTDFVGVDIPAFDYRAFTAISHRNFVPGFVATFRTEGDKTGTSNFFVNSSVGVMSILANHTPGLIPLFQTVQYQDEVVSDANFGAEFEVDWDRVRLLKCENADFTNEASIAAEIEANPECETFYSNVM